MAREKIGAAAALSQLSGWSAVEGRDAIKKALTENLAESKGTKMAIDIKSIRFIKGRAIELGTVTFTPTTGDKSTVAYRAIHAKQADGKWLMTSVGPDVTAEGATRAGPLDDLAWMLGSWKDDEAGVDVTSTCRWASSAWARAAPPARQQASSINPYSQRLIAPVPVAAARPWSARPSAGTGSARPWAAARRMRRCSSACRVRRPSGRSCRC